MSKRRTDPTYTTFDPARRKFNITAPKAGDPASVRKWLDTEQYPEHLRHELAWNDSGQIDIKRTLAKLDEKIFTQINAAGLAQFRQIQARESLDALLADETPDRGAVAAALAAERAASDDHGQANSTAFWYVDLKSAVLRRLLEGALNNAEGAAAGGLKRSGKGFSPEKLAAEVAAMKRAYPKRSLADCFDKVAKGKGERNDPKHPGKKKRACMAETVRKAYYAIKKKLKKVVG